jgi:hypothetical protein
VDAQTVIALAGIAGTLVAALGGTYLGGWLERRAERDRQDLTIRQAARLIDSNLLMAETATRTCIQEHKWWGSGLRLSSEGLDQHRDVIATKLPWDDWVTVIKAIQAVDYLQICRDSDRKIQLARMVIDPDTKEAIVAAERLGLDIVDPTPAIPEATFRQIEAMVAALEAGRTALAGLTQRNPKR